GEPTTIHVYDYDSDHIDFITVKSFDECKPYLQKPTNTWIEVQGLGDVEKLQSIWAYFDVHPLIQEDIITTVQRPKIEQYENCLFIVIRLLSHSAEQQSINSEQISIILGENYL